MRQPFDPTNLRALALALAGLLAIVVVYSRWLGVTNPTIAALSFLLVVLLTATFAALWVAIAASIVAVLVLNYFFLPPIGAWTIAEPQNWVALFVLLVVSLVASNLSSLVRSRAQEVAERRDELARLFELSRDILLMTESGDAHAQLARAIARRFDLPYVAICLPASSTWRIHEAGDGRLKPPVEQLEQVLDAARSTLASEAGDRASSGRHTIHGSDAPPVDLIPLRLGRPIGLLAVAGRELEVGTLDTLAGVAAIAVERIQFLEERKAADLARQGNELKSALLASLAHDLRTPLTAIRVAASNLQASWASDEQRQAQSEIVLAEVERLNRLFQNILDMARIETDAVTAAREWVTPEEIVEAALTQVQHTLARHRVEVEASSSAVLVEVDPRLTSAALAHLLENAAQYSPPGTTISIRAAVDADGVTIAVDDEGPGVSPGDLPHLFDRFFRGRAARGRTVGAGMGLAISRGLLAVQQGTVAAENRAEGGARFSISVPAAVRPAVAAE